MGTKGVPKRCGLTAEEFRDALYNPDCNVRRDISQLKFDKNIGSVCLTNMSKKSLNARYSKLFVKDNLVECIPWDFLKK